MKDVALGQRLAAKLPRPEVKEVKGIKLIVQQVDGLDARQLAALSDYYRQRYGQEAAS